MRAACGYLLFLPALATTGIGIYLLLSWAAGSELPTNPVAWRMLAYDLLVLVVGLVGVCKSIEWMDGVSAATTAAATTTEIPRSTAASSCFEAIIPLDNELAAGGPALVLDLLPLFLPVFLSRASLAILHLIHKLLTLHLNHVI